MSLAIGALPSPFSSADDALDDISGTEGPPDDIERFNALFVALDEEAAAAAAAIAALPCMVACETVVGAKEVGEAIRETTLVSFEVEGG